MYYFYVVNPEIYIRVLRGGAARLKAYDNGTGTKFKHSSISEAGGLGARDLPDDLILPLKGYTLSNKLEYYNYLENSIYVDNYKLFYNADVDVRTYQTCEYPRIYFGIQSEFYTDCKLKIVRGYDMYGFQLPQLGDRGDFYDTIYYVKRSQIRGNSSSTIYLDEVSEQSHKLATVNGEYSILLNQKYQLSVGQTGVLQNVNLKELGNAPDVIAHTNFVLKSFNLTLNEHSYLDTYGDLGTLLGMQSFSIIPAEMYYPGTLPVDGLNLPLLVDTSSGLSYLTYPGIYQFDILPGGSYFFI